LQISIKAGDNDEDAVPTPSGQITDPIQVEGQTLTKKPKRMYE
jgi:hypothetical protein